jgi:plastocyanin
MKKLLALLSLLALAAFGFTACGGGGETSTSDTGAATTTDTASGSGQGSGGTVSLEADPDGQIAYTTDSASTTAGEVTIEFTNPASLPHDVVVEDADGNELARTDVITGDSTSTTAQLDPGEYTFFCSVDAHRDAGMEGTLTAEG